MVSFPYYSHTIPISLGILMGVVWEYIVWERGPNIGVPENSIDIYTKQPVEFSFAQVG